jgi:hypothetical protein
MSRQSTPTDVHPTLGPVPTLGFKRGRKGRKLRQTATSAGLSPKLKLVLGSRLISFEFPSQRWFAFNALGMPILASPRETRQSPTYKWTMHRAPLPVPGYADPDVGPELPFTQPPLTSYARDRLRGDGSPSSGSPHHARAKPYSAWKASDATSVRHKISDARAHRRQCRDDAPQ